MKVSTHLSQSKLENAQIQKRDGCTPTQLLERVGLLNEDLIAAHCIHMTADDVKRFGAAGATVAHVPKGNATGARSRIRRICALPAPISRWALII